MKALITGVAGLLGSRLADYLCDREIEVIGIDDLSGGYIENINEKVIFHNFNLVKDSHQLNKIFDYYKPDYVFHCAGYISSHVRHHAVAQSD